MRKRILAIALLGLALSIPLALLVPTVRAQDSDADKLRDALRQAVAQTRSLEDQRTALQATIAKAQQDNAALKKEVDAARAEQIGLVTEVVTHDQLLPRAVELAAMIAEVPGPIMASLKDMYVTGAAAITDPALAAEQAIAGAQTLDQEGLKTATPKSANAIAARSGRSASWSAADCSPSAGR